MSTPVESTASFQVYNRPSDSVKRHVTIGPLDHGFLVTIGCTSFAFEELKPMMDKIAQYLTDPALTEDKFWKGELFPKV